MAKKKIFISHIGEESEIAKKFKEDILSYTNRGVEIFVSSDEESIYAGDDWEDIVKANIKHCDMMLVIISQKSLNRPWISFETGAAWVKGIKPMPICHGGIDKGLLPKPFSILEAVNADEVGLIKVFRRISLLRDEEFISVNVDDLVKTIKEFDKRYYEVDEIQEFLKLFDQYSISLLKNLNEQNDYTATLRLEESKYNKLLDIQQDFSIGQYFYINLGMAMLQNINNRWINTNEFSIRINPVLIEKINKNQ